MPITTRGATPMIGCARAWRESRSMDNGMETSSLYIILAPCTRQSRLILPRPIDRYSKGLDTCILANPGPELQQTI